MKITRYIAVLISFGVCLCILGIGLIIGGSLSFKKCEKESGKNASTEDGQSKTQRGRCDQSKEAERVKLNETIENVMHIYYSLYPNEIIWHPYAEDDDLKYFRPYNCSPVALKHRTDTAAQLYEQVREERMKVNESELKPQELKSLIQLLHFLKTDFGKPYGENYYSGDWMMGPSRFCAEAICRIGHDLNYHFNTKWWSWQPKTYDDIMYIMEQLQGYKPLIEQYISNIKYGIKAGMVRSEEQCEAGYYSFVDRFQQVSLLGKEGILKEAFVESLLSKEYYKKVPQNYTEEWKINFGESIIDSINSTLVEFVGTPLSELVNFLKNDYRSYCVPSNISSGLASLPLKFIYINEIQTQTQTTQKLPFGEKLNGSRSYEKILYYFTTSEDLTPDKIHELGKQKLKTLYAEAIKAAENETGKSGQDAVDSFKYILNNQSSYFNDAPFPANESNEVAFEKCTSLSQAKIYCPKRHEAFQKWSTFVRETLSLLEPKTIDMFHFTGQKRTTPNCPLQVVPNFIPKTGSQSFRGSGYSCNSPCIYRLPFFMDNLGPKYNAYSVAGHEGRPGHHTQIQGYAENFYLNACSSWIDTVTYYPLFSEGWALYAENPLLGLETDVYKNNPLQKYGMLKWQIWRAIRLIVDTGLHYKGMTRKEALNYHADFAWDTTDKATKDVTRYQSNPGQATAYMIGQLEIWSLRNLAEQKLKEAGKKFSEKDFHFQILSQGNGPTEYLRIHVNKYIHCVVKELGNCETLATGFSQHFSERFLDRSKKMYPVLKNEDLREHFD